MVGTHAIGAPSSTRYHLHGLPPRPPTRRSGAAHHHLLGRHTCTPNGVVHHGTWTLLFSLFRSYLFCPLLVFFHAWLLFVFAPFHRLWSHVLPVFAREAARTLDHLSHLSRPHFQTARVFDQSRRAIVQCDRGRHALFVITKKLRSRLSHVLPAV